MSEVKLTSYPEGYEEVKKMLNVPDDRKDAMMAGFMNTLLTQ